MDSRYAKILDSLTEDAAKSRHQNSNVLIIDSLNTFMRIFAAVPALNDNGDHVGGVVGFLKSIGSNIRQFQATRCILVFDGTGGSTRRRKIYPDYKGNRRNKTTLNRFSEFDGIEDETASMKKQFRRLIEYFDTLPLTVISVDNIEADDTIAYITRNVLTEPDTKITIVSTDRDFLQLADERVSIWSPVKKKLYTPDLIQSEFGIHPNNYLIYRIFDGDSSDNIPGIKGCGIKTLKKRFPLMETEEIGVDYIVKAAEAEISNNSKIKLFKNIVNDKKIINMNEQLMQLQDVDISGSSKLHISNSVNSEITKLNKAEFKKLFMSDGLYVSIKNVESWLYDTFERLNLYARKSK